MTSKAATDDVAIPPMTNPLGAYWEQPDLSDVPIDSTHALLTQKQFDQLADYSASLPSGVYDGKAWKRLDGSFDYEFLQSGGKPQWLLGWYGPSDAPSKCSINFRTILIVSG